MARARTPAPDGEPRTLDAGWITLPQSGPDRLAPELSFIAWGDQEETAVHAHARDLWDVWWSSPMALMWAPSDVPQLERLLLLTVQSWLSPKGAVLGEIRQLEDRFGLNPTARRRLFWRIEGVDVPSTDAEDLSPKPVAEKVGPPKAGKSNDPRLRVVRGGKKAAG